MNFTKAAHTYRIATLTVDAKEIMLHAKTGEERTKFIFDLLEVAAASSPDVIVLPEDCWYYGLPQERWPQEAERRDGLRAATVAKFARTHGCYIAMPMLESRGNEIFNTLLLIDRRGRVVWHYDKVFLTENELKCGFSNGRQTKAYDADFGRLGAAICFDLNFLELAHAWERQQVDLILFSSMYRGGPMVLMWSLITHAYVVSATSDEGSKVVDPLGRCLGRTSNYSPVLVRDLPRDFEVFHIDYNEQKWPSLRATYGDQIDLEIESEVAQFLLQSRAPGISISRIIDEYKLLPLRKALPLWRRRNSMRAARLGGKARS